jgi:hypothetical protein
MKQKRLFILLSCLAAFGLSGFLVVSCESKSPAGMIILTQSDEENLHADYVSGSSWRFVHRGRLVAIRKNKPGKSPELLSEAFYSACSPDISYDGKYMLFAGQLREGDVWQIWEMNLENSRVRLITASEDNCTDPVYLPGDRLAYSKFLANDSLNAGFSLYTGNLDGTSMQRITFNPYSYFASSTLHDGRLLTIGRQLYPALDEPLLMVMRPDGTKADMFYQGLDHTVLSSRAMETANRNIIFVETDSANPESGHLVSIHYNRPLNSRTNLTSGIEGIFSSVVPEPSGKLLVTYRKSDADRYALYEFDPVNKELGQVVYASPDHDVLDVVVVEERTRPKKLPSEVDMGVKTGLLLCQNIHILDPGFPVKPATAKKAVKIEVLGLSSSMGIVTVEEDGSFYLKAIADTPFRIRTLDEDNKVVNGPSSWIWLRPNERRGCVGCHEDHELAPENNVPLSVKKDPVLIPVHVSEVTEKEVELE